MQIPPVVPWGMTKPHTMPDCNCSLRGFFGVWKIKSCSCFFICIFFFKTKWQKAHSSPALLNWPSASYWSQCFHICRLWRLTYFRWLMQLCHLVCFNCPGVCFRALVQIISTGVNIAPSTPKVVQTSAPTTPWRGRARVWSGYFLTRI